MKKLALIAVLFAVVLSLSGCGGGTSPFPGQSVDKRHVGFIMTGPPYLVFDAEYPMGGEPFVAHLGDKVLRPFVVDGSTGHDVDVVYWRITCPDGTVVCREPFAVVSMEHPFIVPEVTGLYKFRAYVLVNGSLVCYQGDLQIDSY